MLVANLSVPVGRLRLLDEGFCADVETLSQFLREVLADAAFPGEDTAEVALIRDSLLSQLVLADSMSCH